MSFTLASNVSLTRLTVTPVSSNRERLHQVTNDASVPEGVHMSPAALDSVIDLGQSRPLDPRTVASPGFTPEEVAKVRQHTVGAGSWATVETDSGIRGEALQTSDGIQFRLLLPDGVLPEPLLVERGPHQVSAHTLEGRTLPAREKADRLEVDLGSNVKAVLSEEDFSLAMEGPTMLERVLPNNRHQLLIDQQNVHTLGFDGVNYQECEHGYLLEQNRQGEWTGAYHWSAPETTSQGASDYRVTLQVETRADGHLELTPKQDWWSRLNDGWHSHPGSPTSALFKPCDDLVDVTPFSALSASEYQQLSAGRLTHE